MPDSTPLPTLVDTAAALVAAYLASPPWPGRRADGRECAALDDLMWAVWDLRPTLAQATELAGRFDARLQAVAWRNTDQVLYRLRRAVEVKRRERLEAKKGAA